MFIRFQGAIVLAVLTAVAASALEKRANDLRREIGRQHYRLDVLRERVARLRLRTERLSAPELLLRPIEEGRLRFSPSGSADSDQDAAGPAVGPLLRWRPPGGGER